MGRAWAGQAASVAAGLRCARSRNSSCWGGGLGIVAVGCLNQVPHWPMGRALVICLPACMQGVVDVTARDSSG